MKKISLYVLLGVMSVFMASCEDDNYVDWADPQSNPQEDAITIPGFSISSIGSLIDLNGVDADSVQVFKLNTATLPEGYELGNVRVEFTANGADGANTTTLASDIQGRVSTSELQAIIENDYGKNPTARSYGLNVLANAVNNGQAVLINAGSITSSFTPEAPYISEHYYLIGAPSAWAVDETSMPFTHSGKDVYEDPVFTVTFPVADGDTWFAITDDKTIEAGDWSYVLGCAEGNGNNGETGKIARRSEIGNDGSFKVSVNGDAKFVRVTLNMMEYTYTIEKLNFAEYIYEVGNNTNWGGGTLVPLASPNFDGQYVGYAYLNGEFKFKPNDGNDWNGDWEMVTGGTAYEGTLSENGNSNISAPETGFYRMDVDLAAMTYKLTAITGISLVGDAVNGDTSWGTDYDLTYDAAKGCWTGTYDMTAGSYKFRANKAWAISWGGSLDNLTTNNGANLSIAEAGTYEFNLYVPCEGKSYATVAKK